MLLKNKDETMIIKGAKAYLPEHSFMLRDIRIENGSIAEVAENLKPKANEEVIDAGGLLAIPGLVDIHFHGAMGCDFCDATKEAIETLAGFEASRGVLAICPATMTYDETRINAVIDAALEYNADCADTLPQRALLCGINLEGPFISKNRIGAQNPEYVIPPDTETIGRLLSRSKGLVKTIAIAPETEGAAECIKKYGDRVVFSLAHTDADYETAEKAFENGAKHVTHLYNAMAGMNHRKPGIIPAACEAGAEAELICDGVHVHPAMVRIAFRLFGADKMILISDSMRACGLGDGEYDLGGQNVAVSGRLAVLKEDGKTIAGSVTDLYTCMKKAVEFGISREDAIRAASENPARSIGIEDRFGQIKEGAIGHLLLTDEDLNLVKII